MLLTVDIGNSALKWAVFDGERLVRAERCAKADEIPDVENVDAIAVASVVPDAGDAACGVLEDRFKVFPALLGRNFRVPLEVRCREPERVGADRLLNALAAYDAIGARCVVVDVGSAITVDAVGDKGTFLGGAIAPGPRLCALSLHEHTALLPSVNPASHPSPVGQDTEGAIQAGLYHGCRGTVRELVTRTVEALGRRAVVIATGGYAPWVADLGCVTRAEANLTLIGLRLAWGTADTAMMANDE